MHGILHSGLKIDQRQVDDIIVIDLAGDFDSRSAGTAKNEIKALIDKGNVQILINLESVPYMDSAGLGTLVSALKAAREKGGSVYLCNMTDQVRMVVELTRLNRVFTIFSSVEDALTKLKDPNFRENVE